MPIRIYRAIQIGTGTRKDPYRSILNNFIDIWQGDTFDEIDNPLTKYSICTVSARQSVHDALYKDRLVNPGRIIYLSSLSLDDSEKRTNLSIPWSSLPFTFKTEILKVITVDGFDIAEIKVNSTLKDIIRLLLYKNFRQQVLSTVRVVPSNWGTFKFAGEDF